MKKVLAGVLGLAMMVTVSPMVGNAQTTADLQAQINSLLATIAQLQAQLAVQTGGGLTGQYNFTQDLTVGSTGGDVTSLQQFLVGGGYLNMPIGVSYGYFGPLTRAAVASWQAANGISPAVGYFGPISRARANAMGQAGTPGTPGTPTTPGSGITTPGVEGILTVSKNPTPSSGQTLREGDMMAPVLGLKIEAKNSDLAVQRVKLNLGASTAAYTKIFSRVYLMDGSTVVAESDLNSNTVFKEGSDNYVQLTGFNWVVPRNTTRVLTVAFDVYNVVRVADQGSRTITLSANGVRALDGAGIDQQSPSTAFSNSVTISGSLTDNASLVVSLATNSPEAREVIADQNTDSDEYDELTVGMVQFKAEKDDVTVTDAVVSITRGGNTSTATSSTAYLYDGSTLIGSAVVNGTSATAMTATFTDIDWTIARDTTKTLTVKLDIKDAGSSATTFMVAVTGSSQTAENSTGSTVTPTGSATSEAVTVRDMGPEITLLSKTIEKGLIGGGENATSTALAKFTLRVTAVGGDVMFGNAASTTYPMVTNSVLGTPSFVIYRGGAEVAPGSASTTSVTVPGSGVVTSGLTNSFTLQDGNTVDIPVSFLFEGRTPAGALITTGSYAVALENINWIAGGSLQTSSFMDGKTSWRTSEVSMP